MKLPPLREELSVTPGARSHDGQPSWTLHDPARNRFFRLDWLTFEILQRWSLGEPQQVAGAVAEQTPLRPDAADVSAVLNFAAANQWLAFAGADNSRTLAGLRARARLRGWRWLVHNYLFFRIPLVRPQTMLEQLERTAGFLYRTGFWIATLGAALLGLKLVASQWTAFVASWTELATFHGVLGYVVVLIGVKLLHECGHGLAAVHFGCQVPAMGIAFLVLTPVAYTDVNDAWRLKDRGPRLWISAAGMLAELALAAWATLAWGLLPEGSLRSAAFMVATTTWVKSLVVNLSPVMRFDGYYLLSDWLEMPNLHARSFALARWRLREVLFGLGEPMPERLPHGLQRNLTGLAVFIWIYRLIVFTGIALFVYHFFFKALGIVLFAVEIAWFIALPVAKELQAWWSRRRRLFRSPRTRWLAGAGLILIALAFIPMPQRVRVAGEFRPQTEFRLTATEAADLRAWSVRDGERVKAGQPLVQLESPLLRSRWEKAAAREKAAKETLISAGTNALLRARLPVLQQEWEQARAAREEAEVLLSRLTPTAPFDGLFRRSDPELQAGLTVEAEEALGTLIAPGPWTVVAYVGEQDVHLIAAGARALLFVDGAGDRALPLEVTAVELDATRSLLQPVLASPFGGPIPARMDGDKLVPDHVLYRVTLRAEEPPAPLGGQVRRGRVVIHAAAESLAARWSRAALSVLARELGF